MVRREEADSGLRKGFIREDEAMQLAKSATRENTEDNTQAPEKTEEVVEDNKTVVTADKAEETKPDGPTISMQGVSGKTITSVVKVVKKVSRAKKADKADAAKESTKVKSDDATKVAEQTVATNDKETVDKNVADKTDKTTEKKVVKSVKDKDDQSSKAAEAEVVEVTKSASEQQDDSQSKPKPDSAATDKDSAKPVKTAAEVKTSVDVKVDSANTDKAEPANKQADVQSAASEDTASQTKTSPASNVKVDRSGVARQVKTDTSGNYGKVQPASAQRRTVVDRGVTSSRYSHLPRIRPQQGNYLGQNAATPQAELRQQRGDHRGQGFHNDGQRPRNFGGEKRKFNREFMDKDAPSTNQPQRRQQRSNNNRNNASFGAMGGERRADRRNNQRRERSRFDQMQATRYGADESYDDDRFRRNTKKRGEENKVQRAVLTNVKLPETLTVKELAETLKKTSAEVITKLMSYGVMATLNQELNFDTAEVIANEFGIKAEQLIEVKAEDILFDDSQDKEEDLVERPPIVVVMGHVDHGKTSILDYIRNTSVVQGEAGGITQHIGAYTVDVNGKTITFLDTPGHEAFTVMRARGAQVTDIAILVVAADDGVMPQTIEAINHARAANTEIIVAVNKIDRPGANIDRVRQELANHNLMSSDWGGNTTIVPVSAKTGENMDELLEMILLTAEVLELKANPNRQAKGTVIEAKLDRGRGTVATMLVQRGTLRVGDTVVVGSMIGHIRAMMDDKGRDITEAGPSQPVEILGLPEVPEGGDIFYSVQNEKVARQLVERRQAEERENKLRQKNRLSLDNLFEQMSKGEVKDLNIIVKADVQGSVEAVKQSLEKLSNEEVQVKVIHGAVGAVTESDVRLAEIANAIIIGFNVRPAAKVSDLAEENNVDIRLYRIIYDAIEDTEKALKGMLAPTYKEVVLGHATVRETFNVSGVGTIAGCYVTDGKITRTADVRIVRDGIVIHEGKIASLKRFKDDAREVAAGYECGMSIERYNDIKIGDQFETFEMQEVKVE